MRPYILRFIQALDLYGRIKPVDSRSANCTLSQNRGSLGCVVARVQALLA